MLVTDERLSSAAAHAQVVLPVNVHAPSPFYTFSGGIILVELLALSVLHALGERGRQHLTKWETVRGGELVFSPDPETNGQGPVR